MPVIHLDITDDDEFISCHQCKKKCKPYNNSVRSNTPQIDSAYTKKLLEYHHANCEKCGVYVEFHPRTTDEEGLIFLCPDRIPHRHCLCFECGLLYDLEANPKKTDILKQIQFSHASTAAPSGEIEAETAESPSTNVNDTELCALNVVSHTPIIAQMMQQMASSMDDVEADNATSMSTPESSSMGGGDAGNSTLFIGTIAAVLVWIGIYVSSPELFRLTGCLLWFSIFYYLTNMYYVANESMQRVVFSLFGFSPILAAIYVLDRSRRWNSAAAADELTSDFQSFVRFVCVFGCIAYFAFIWSPMDMCLFLSTEFMQLSLLERMVSIFIAVSVAAFVALLFKNCKSLTSTLLYGRRERVVDKNAACVDLDVGGHGHVDTQCVVEPTSPAQPEAAAAAVLAETNVDVDDVSSHKRKRKRRKRAKKRVDNYN